MRKFLSATALALSLGSGSPAQAEDEIIVTATRTPTPLSRLPARVETIDRADIEAENLVTLSQALGADAVQGGGAGQQGSVFLRGANSKHTLALFDGIRLNDASTPNAQYDFGLDTLGAIERIEVLRGPAGAIYGSDAIGGVVNMIPRRGGDGAFEPFAEAALGSFNTRRGLIGAAGAAGALEYGLSAEAFETSGHDIVPRLMATHTGDADGAAIETYTGSARFDLGAVAVDGIVRVREASAEFDTFSGGASFDLRADDPDLENQATQSLWRLGAESQAGAAWRLRVSGGEARSDRAETDGGAQTSAAESTQSFADASARFTHGETVLHAGLAFERAAIETQPQFADPLRVSEDQGAFYLTGQTHFAERFNATGSVRVDTYASFATQATYALGVVASLAPVRLFASLGTAFKAPSLSERFETSRFNLGNRGLDPERSRSWEIGADWAALAEDRLTLGASLYQTHVQDQIEYAFGQSRNVNIARASMDGGEFYAVAAPISWLRLRVNYVWTDARDQVSGARLARRPAQSWRLDARAQPSERIGMVFSWNYVGERMDVTYDDAGAFVAEDLRAERSTPLAAPEHGLAQRFTAAAEILKDGAAGERDNSERNQQMFHRDLLLPRARAANQATPLSVIPGRRSRTRNPGAAVTPVAPGSRIALRASGMTEVIVCILHQDPGRLYKSTHRSTAAAIVVRSAVRAGEAGHAALLEIAHLAVAVAGFDEVEAVNPPGGEHLGLVLSLVDADRKRRSAGAAPVQPLAADSAQPAGTG